MDSPGFEIRLVAGLGNNRSGCCCFCSPPLCLSFSTGTDPMMEFHGLNRCVVSDVSPVEVSLSRTTTHSIIDY